DRYFKIYGKLDRTDDAFADDIPTTRENVQLKILYDNINKLERVDMKRQAEILSLEDDCFSTM
ncbi:hypothetical protein JG688_00015959, partial [Phytophthora aleatoria]